MWDVRPDFETIVLDVQRLAIEDVINSEFNTKSVADMDFGVRNLRIENAEGAVDIRFFLRAAGHTYVDIDQTFRFPLGGCVDVYHIGVAGIQICFYKPNRVCVDA